MIRISFNVTQPALASQAISGIFLDTGMSIDEAEYYAGQIVGGNAFEIEAPDTDVVDTMITRLKTLDVNMDIERDYVQ